MSVEVGQVARQYHGGGRLRTTRNRLNSLLKVRCRVQSAISLTAGLAYVQVGDLVKQCGHEVTSPDMRALGVSDTATLSPSAKVQSRATSNTKGVPSVVVKCN